jgi:hypothetical protein
LHSPRVFQHILRAKGSELLNAHPCCSAPDACKAAQAPTRATICACSAAPICDRQLTAVNGFGPRPLRDKVGGVVAFSPLWIVIGALISYVSEYGFHRFGFHALPLWFALVRKLQGMCAT